MSSLDKTAAAAADQGDPRGIQRMSDENAALIRAIEEYREGSNSIGTFLANF